MFTGIVEALGSVQSVSPLALALVPQTPLADLQLGESILVNGCCLTLTSLHAPLLFDLSEETWERTTFADIRPGDLVNLERAMPASGRFGGHIVQGHVDVSGIVEAIRPEAGSTIMTFGFPASYGRYLIDKGSVAVDGVSLTVIQPTDTTFDVAIIPHTLEHTNLGQKQPGDRVNLEFDVLAKYLEKLRR